MTRAERIGLALGVALTVVGGLVAAVTGPLQLERGSWAAAYLVLIAGVMQGVLAAARLLVRPDRTPRPPLPSILVLWNAGNAAVLGGSIATLPLVTDAGGLVLLVTLALALGRLRGAAHRARAVWLGVLSVGIGVSVPVGLLLTHLRALAGG